MTSGRGLIGRIARHGTSAHHDPNEDRLTEVCAALFDSPWCEGLAQHVTCSLLGTASNHRDQGNRDLLEDLLSLLGSGRRWSCRVSTQLPIVVEGRSRRPDLELRFADETGDELAEIVIWLEVKHGTGPHTEQLQDYVKAHAARGHYGAVLLVAPKGRISPLQPR